MSARKLSDKPIDVLKRERYAVLRALGATWGEALAGRRSEKSFREYRKRFMDQMRERITPPGE